MSKPLQELATDVLMLLAKMRSATNTRGEVDGATLAEITSLLPDDLNDAISLLQRSGYVEWRQYLGTSPFVFGHVWITPVGRYEAERVSSILAEPLNTAPSPSSKAAVREGGISLPPAPIGSPYGFNDEDWEFIAEQKDRASQLSVVMGYQFDSAHYDSASLRDNVRVMFQVAVDRYNELPGSLKTILDFRPLAAGYGEHLFNEIARDIIASDIAVFDTSDLNPNVMVELGVALTWGIRVLPIKLHTKSNPPSDISGQTWASYEDSAYKFLDPDHGDKLVRMVERAIRKKGRSK
jgi:hypothetical protein